MKIRLARKICRLVLVHRTNGGYSRQQTLRACERVFPATYERSVRELAMSMYDMQADWLEFCKKKERELQNETA